MATIDKLLNSNGGFKDYAGNSYIKQLEMYNPGDIPLYKVDSSLRNIAIKNN